MSRDIKESLFLGKPFPYWIELNAHAKLLACDPLIEEIVRLQQKILFYEHYMNAVTSIGETVGKEPCAMNEPAEKTYYVLVYEKCRYCDGRGYEYDPPRNFHPSCLLCEGTGFMKVYIPLAEWAAQMRERSGPGMPGAYTVTFAPDNTTYTPDNTTYTPDNTTYEPQNVTLTRGNVTSEKIPFTPGEVTGGELVIT